VIPPGFIQDLLSRIDIVEVVGRHVELKKAGINHKGLCPFHSEKSPSFTVSASRQTYHCFGCGVHGNAIGFLMEHTGAGFVEAVEDLAQQAGMQVPQDERSAEQREAAKAQKAKEATLTEVLARASDHYRAQLKKSPRAIDYLKKRGLTGQIAARFALGYAPEGWRTLASAFPSYDDPRLAESGMVITSGEEGSEQKRYDRFRDRVMFPIRNVQGDFIGFGGRILDKGEPKYLNSPETPVFHKGRELYGLFEGRQGLRQRGYALVVEGYMDVVALAQHGFANAVATLGTACTAEHVQKLFRFTESVVFSFDGDAAGRRAAGRALEAALPHATDTRSVKFLFLPAEHDPDSYVRELGAEAFERCVGEAVPLSRQLVEAAAEGCDLGSAEGRARFLANAKPLWNALPQGLLKRQLLGELARQAQLPDQELMGLWQTGAMTAPQPAGRDSGPDYGEPPPHPEDSGAAPERKPRREWKPDWKPAGKGRGDWKRRGEPQDETFGTPRRQPLSPADRALRMLLLNSSWWERLSDRDHQLLHELPGRHGELITWLERYLVNHGPASWAVLQLALAEDGLTESAQQSVTELFAEEETDFTALQRVVNNLRTTQLAAEKQLLAQNPNPSREELQRYRELDAEIRALTATAQSETT
jgi:DNA primase